MELGKLLPVAAVLVVVALAAFYLIGTPVDQEFESGVDELNAVWAENEFDLSREYSNAELLATEEEEFEGLKFGLFVLMDSFESEKLLDLANIHSWIAEELHLKKLYLTQEQTVSGMEEELCENLEKVTDLIATNQELYDMKLETNALINDFIEEYPEEAEGVGLSQNLLDGDELFQEWFDAKDAALTEGERCEGDVE